MKATAKQLELVQQWGYQPINKFGSFYTRQAPQGYVEHWFPRDPETIHFIKDGHFSHQYKIDWSLFIKEAA